MLNTRRLTAVCGSRCQVANLARARLPAQYSTAGMQNCILIDDNAPQHRAAVVLQLKEQLGIPTLHWPSADMNPIEHAWDLMKRDIRQRESPPQDAAELALTVAVTSQRLPQTAVNRLVLSMPQRVAALLQSRGAYTRYWFSFSNFLIVCKYNVHVLIHSEGNFTDCPSSFPSLWSANVFGSEMITSCVCACVLVSTTENLVPRAGDKCSTLSIRKEIFVSRPGCAVFGVVVCITQASMHRFSPFFFCLVDIGMEFTLVHFQVLICPNWGDRCIFVRFYVTATR